MKSFLLKLSILVIAFGLPLGGLALLAGGLPSSLSLSALSQWTPIRSPGISTVLMSKGLTALLGLHSQNQPDWIQEPDLILINQIKQAFADNNLQQLTGNVVLLLDRLEQHQRPIQDIMSVILPDLSTWFLANYFTPLLLITLFGLVSLFLCGQWLLRHFYDLLKFFIVIAVGLIAVGMGIWVCTLIFSEKSLMFTMIEYFSLSFILWVGLNGVVFRFKKSRPASIAASPSIPPSTPVLDLDHQIEYHPESALTLAAKRIGYQKVGGRKRVVLRAQRLDKTST